MTTTLMQAHHEWATRPADERFTSLDQLLAKVSRDKVIADSGRRANRVIEAQPVILDNGDPDPKGLVVMGADIDRPCSLTNWSFGQLCSLVGAPAGYLSSLPSFLAADCLNQSMLGRKREELGYLLADDRREIPNLRALTGPTYGRIWNAEIVSQLIRLFGSGPDAEFTVPGEFGKTVPITTDNTTLFAGDRDMFVFLADERNRIEVPGRRPGQVGSLARGFFIRNSEVGASTLRIGTFLFDYVCANRIVWGAEGFQEVAIRHSSRAPGRWLDEVAPALHQLANNTDDSFAITHALTAARARRLDEDAVDKVLAKRFTVNQAKGIKLAHIIDEGRPMESVWDVVTGATAYARGLKHQDQRVSVERIAGAIMADNAQ